MPWVRLGPQFGSLFHLLLWQNRRKENAKTRAFFCAITKTRAAGFENCFLLVERPPADAYELAGFHNPTTLPSGSANHANVPVGIATGGTIVFPPSPSI